MDLSNSPYQSATGISILKEYTEKPGKTLKFWLAAFMSNYTVLQSFFILSVFNLFNLYAAHFTQKSNSGWFSKLLETILAIQPSYCCNLMTINCICYEMSMLVFLKIQFLDKTLKKHFIAQPPDSFQLDLEIFLFFQMIDNPTYLKAKYDSFFSFWSSVFFLKKQVKLSALGNFHIK